MNLTACPVCSSKDFKPVLEVQDYLVSRETFTICECPQCTVRFTNPRPEVEDLSNYYQSEDYVSHTNEGNNLVNKLYKIARYFTLRSKRKLIQKNTIGKKLLDVGCGTGHFLKHASHNNWDVFGVEPDEKARRIAQTENGLDVVSSIEELKENSFDRITLWHVLEHLPDLVNTLNTMIGKLSNQGKLFIAVPNYQAYEEKKFKEHWAAYDVPRHLYHFSPRSMEILMARNGLIVEKVYPMWLDSFYISILSNKHKSNRNNYLKSFITGSLSNIYGIKSGNFSSLVYQIGRTE